MSDSGSLSEDGGGGGGTASDDSDYDYEASPGPSRPRGRPPGSGRAPAQQERQAKPVGSPGARGHASPVGSPTSGPRSRTRTGATYSPQQAHVNDVQQKRAAREARKAREAKVQALPAVSTTLDLQTLAREVSAALRCAACSGRIEPESAAHKKGGLSHKLTFKCVDCSKESTIDGSKKLLQICS